MLELMIPRRLYPRLLEEANKRNISVKKLIIETLLAAYLKEGGKQ